MDSIHHIGFGRQDFNDHENSRCDRLILVPRVIAVFIEHRIVGGARSHGYLEIQSIDIFFQTLLHLTVADYVGMDFFQEHITAVDVVLVKSDLEWHTARVIHVQSDIAKYSLGRDIVTNAFESLLFANIDELFHERKGKSHLIGDRRHISILVRPLINGNEHAVLTADPVDIDQFHQGHMGVWIRISEYRGNLFFFCSNDSLTRRNFSDRTTESALARILLRTSGLSCYSISSRVIFANHASKARSLTGQKYSGTKSKPPFMFLTITIEQF